MAEAVIPADFGGDQVVLTGGIDLVYTASPRASASEPENVIFQNNTAIDITVGGPDVGDGINGVLLPASGNNSVTVPFRAPLTKAYAFAASGTPPLNVVRA